MPMFFAAFTLLLFCQLIPAAGVANAQSSAAGASLQDFLACQTIEKRKARYKCYDALESGDRVPSAATTSASAVPDAAKQREEFGQPAYVKESGDLQALTVQIVSATLGRSGKWTFRTSEGQVWRQVNSRRARYRDQNFEAEISKAPLSGFYFKQVGEKIRLRVKRIK